MGGMVVLGGSGHLEWYGGFGELSEWCSWRALTIISWPFLVSSIP